MITQIEQFKEVIEGNYGIIDLKSYEEYKIKASKEGIKKTEVDLLSPDNINSCSFWEYIEKNPEIAKDAVSFGITKEQTIADANKRNLDLAWSMGVFNMIMLVKNNVGMPILDIGAGYGMMKEFVEQNTKLKYYGVDVYPKIEGVDKVSEDGSTLPPNIMATKFGMIISTNVFQHLSIKQRRHYYEQVEKILMPGFPFTVSISTWNPANTSGRRPFFGEDGKPYMCHYGQYTEVQTVQEIEKDLLNHFDIHSITQRIIDGTFAFNCIRRMEPVRTEA